MKTFALILVFVSSSAFLTACPDEEKPLSPAQQKRLDNLLNKSNPEQMNVELLKLQENAGARVDELKALDARKEKALKARSTKDIVIPPKD